MFRYSSFFIFSLAGCLCLALAEKSCAQDWTTSPGNAMIPPVRIDPSTANGAALTSPAPMTQLVPVPNAAGSYPPSSGGGYAINTPPSLSTPPSASLGTPAFDPYGTTTQGGLFAPPSAYPQTSTIPGTNPWGSIYGGTAGATTGYSMTGPGPYPTARPFKLSAVGLSKFWASSPLSRWFLWYAHGSRRLWGTE